MIRIDEIWLSTQALDMRAGTVALNHGFESVHRGNHDYSVVNMVV